jgi:hypothetical protein
MKITKRQLKQIIREEKNRLVKEANVDGTVSDNEEEHEEDMMVHVEVTIDELLSYISGEAMRIGGSFRGPGIKSRALRLLADKIHRHR